MIRIQNLWKRVSDFCVYRILHADDPPHRLALGLAVATFATFTPLIGLQMVLTVFLAWLFRANKFVGLPIVWISNPLTIVPIYFPCYALGCWLTGTPVIEGKLEHIRQEWRSLGEDSSWGCFSMFEFCWNQLADVAIPLFVGCTVVGLTFAVIIYYVALLLITRFRNQIQTAD